jgi:hypothetical protein
MYPARDPERQRMGLESFLLDKMTGLAYFMGAVIFFFAGVASSKINGILTAVLLLDAAILVGVSLWFIRKR